jgi:serine protease inhibitor
VEQLERRICLAGDSTTFLLESSGQGDTARAVHAINCFAIDLYEHVQEEQGSLFLSPTIIATALAMTYAGAARQAADEMEKVLHLSDEPGIHASFRDLISSFEHPKRFQVLCWNWPRQSGRNWVFPCVKN